MNEMRNRPNAAAAEAETSGRASGKELAGIAVVFWLLLTNAMFFFIRIFESQVGQRLLNGLLGRHKS